LHGLLHRGDNAGPPSRTTVVAASLERAGFDLRAQIIWVKQWCGDRTQTTVRSVPNLNPFGGRAGAEIQSTGHSTQKPVALFERPILNHAAPPRRDLRSIP
jgi:DNA modification methylase